MSLIPGTRLGPYEILSPLGAGGMGQVYKARDTRLDRMVAVKILAPELSARQELRERLQREARTISSLNHPNICVLHDIGHQDGIDFLVMEYLEGDTLAERLKKGALPLSQGLRYAMEITDALDKAHRQGIIHRDLKPGNIMLTKTGAKLLDFGLAKLRELGKQTQGVSMLPTQEASLTAEGTILGTLHYMAPEQLEGKEVDERADIFALGAVIYELVTGQKAFQGESHASVIAGILDRDPPSICALQPIIPRALDRLVNACLAKDPNQRWQAAHDLHLELKWISETSSQEASAGASAVPRRRDRLGWIVAATLSVFLIAALVIAVTHLRETSDRVESARFLVFSPEKTFFRPAVVPAVSPDGEHIVTAAFTPDGKNPLWIRPLNSIDFRSLPGTDGAFFPFWSPDSGYIAFFAEGMLRKLDLSSGPPQAVCDAPGALGGSWSRNGMVVFAPNPVGPLHVVSAGGGKSNPVTKLNQSRQETSHRWPYFLPDGQRFLYLAISAQPENSGIYLGSLDGEEPRLLISTDSNAVCTPPGYIVFVRDDVLLAQPFDSEAPRLEGQPVPIAEGVAVAMNWSAPFSLSENGVLVYRQGRVFDTNQFIWFDREGNTLQTLWEAGQYSNPDLSPDGRRLAVGRYDPHTKARDLWLLDLVRNAASRFTFSPSDDLNPAWSPDGLHIFFTSNRKKGIRDIYEKAVRSTGDEQVLLAGDHDKSVNDISSDGKYLVYDTGGGTADLWVLSLSEEKKATPFLATEFDERSAQISPNGKWIAYASNESGISEIYVQTFPKPRGKVQISNGGGGDPRWRSDGKELFFIATNKLMAAEVQTDDPAFEATVPRVLFQTQRWIFTGRNRYVAAPDGQRFLANTSIENTVSSPITVVLNWTAELSK